MTRLTPAVVLALLLCPACTEYVGPPASPLYWKAPKPDTEPGPQAIFDDPPAAPQRDVVYLPENTERDEQPRARSISLGYTGDGVLAGGVTRDSVIEPRPQPGPYDATSWQDYVNAPQWRSGEPFRHRSACSRGW